VKSNNAEFIPQSGLSATRVKIASGAVTRTQSHETETIIVVLEGTFRLRLGARLITLKKDNALRIPAHQDYSAEALADTVALKIAATTHQESQHTAQPHDDPDQYLWGV
jgi:quercetin dioxygenase-like cupin family protein